MAMQAKDTLDNLLAECFKDLAKEHPIDKITIKEITDKAGVIRPTFYNHFQDKYELLEWIIMTELLQPIQPLIENRMLNEALLLLFTSIENEKEFYSQAIKLEGQNSFESIVENSVTRILGDVIPKSPAGLMPKFEWLTAERIATYYAKSMCYVVFTWIKSGFAIPPKELVEIYEYIMKHSMDDILSGE